MKLPHPDDETRSAARTRGAPCPATEHLHTDTYLETSREIRALDLDLKSPGHRRPLAPLVRTLARSAPLGPSEIRHVRRS